MLKVKKIKVQNKKIGKLVVENQIQQPKSYTAREYKDRLFKFIFKDKEKLLSLYNALNDTHYTNPEEIEITTLEDVIYCHMKNDVSFIIDGRLSLFEHQSTFNPNMPLRGFLYFAKHFETYIEEYQLDIYRSSLLELPTPKFVVFYNGKDMKEDKRILRLSNSFSKTKEKACMELEALVLNINYGKNKELMESCRPLMEYSYFVEKVKQYSLKMKRDNAIDMAVAECIEKDILKDILIRNRAEVVDMLLTEYDEEKRIRLMENEIQIERQRVEEMRIQLEQEKLKFKSQLEQEQQKRKQEEQKRMQEQIEKQALLKKLQELENQIKGNK